MESNDVKENNECILTYEIKTYQEKVHLFGKDFCVNNSKNCEIIINNQKTNIFEYYENKNFEKIITVKLILNKDITDLSYMFSGCSSLSSISDISNWDTKNIINMKWMFYGCNSLKSLPDISKWDISKVTDIQFIFSGCKSLTNLPDISKWNIKNVININGVFSDCSSLKSLPDISKWDTSNIININNLFSSCTSLKILPDISKWNTSKVKNMSCLFQECISLTSLPDISKWDTSKVINMSNMFSKCVSLKNVPDISKWNISNTIDISFMFNNCLSLISLPDLSKWDTSNIINMNSLFLGCHLLSSLPDLSKWKTFKVTDMSRMFSKCSSLKRLPDISKWNTSTVTEMVNMFSECSSLSCIPNISVWDFSGVYDKSNMFSGCKCDFLKEKIFDDYNKNIYNEYNELNFNIDKNNIIRNENLRIFPQIEMKFDNIDFNNVTENMIKQLKTEIRNLLNEDNFSIIEIRKGSLIVILTLQFIILNEIKKHKNELNFNISRIFDENIKEEVKKISEKLKNNSFISLGTVKPDYVDEYIIDISNENNKETIVGKILELSNSNINNIVEENDINIYEMCKLEDLENYCKQILKDAEIQEKNQIKLIKDMKEFNNLFDEAIENSLKNSIFEFKISYIFLIDQEKNNYINEKNKCPNKEIKILFHGTQEDINIKILSEGFKPSPKGAIGKGVYFTDSLDYAWNYYKAKKVRKLGIIPKVGEYFSFVASEIYYDNDLLEDIINNLQTILISVQKNGVRCCYGYFNGNKILRKSEFLNYKGPIGKEYLIAEKSQILPLYSITAKRLEYLVIWRDYNFDPQNPNKYNIEIFRQMTEFHRKIKKIISREFDSKIYYSKTSEEALELIERKKYNKVIIITNANNNAKNFIKMARKIIGANVIVGISVYNIPLHISWIKMMQNVMLLNGEDFHYKFLKAILFNNNNFLDNGTSLNNLRNKIINYYTPKIQDFGLKAFNSDLLKFPKFKREGMYTDLTFEKSEEEKKNCLIF